MRVLIVEDEKKLGELIKNVLRKEGYAVDYLADGEKAQRRIQINYTDYDLIILDLSLPNKGGLEICKEVRQANIATPILILTANNSLESKTLLLDSGADDYLVKPFDFKELLSRVRAVTRRPQQVLASELKVADITLNPSNLKVFKSNKEVKLTLKEFRILEFLMRNPNKVLSREEITSNIWDFDYDSFSNVIDVFINKVRSKVDTEKNRRLIETVRGIGYKMNDFSVVS